MPKKQFISWLLSADSGVKLYSVVGAAGLGKTTLVKNVYNDAAVNKHFDVPVWISISNLDAVRYRLIDIIEQLCGEISQEDYQQLVGMSVNNLKEGISSVLVDKRYIIIVDGVWEKNVWTSIKSAFPKNQRGSRIVITTCHDDIGEDACQDTGGHVLRLKPLPQEESWILFCKKAFPSGPCPPHLMAVARNILNHCAGAPLAILVIGGALSRKNNRIEEWEMFHHRLAVASDQCNEKTESIKKLLSLGYNDLPYYLKSCFLYFSIFPEDHIIDKPTLIRLWAAEGFLQVKEGKTKEEVGESYLNELVNRSLVQVDATHIDGRLKTCSIRDVFHDLVLRKGREWNIGSIDSGSDTRWPDKVRRLIIQYSIGRTPDLGLGHFLLHHSNDSMERTKGDCRFGHLRSLVLFGNRCSLSKTSLFKFLYGVSTLMLLKVIDLRGSDLEKIPDGVFELFHLRYLNLSKTKVKDVPKSIGKLQNLEFLDLKNTKVKKLPVEILKLQRLEHLLVNRRGPKYILGFEAPCKIGNLVSLQKLADVKANDTKLVKEIGKLTQLTLLGITRLRRKDGMELCSSLEKLTNLRSLSINALQEKDVVDLQYPISPTPQFLRSLQIGGPMEKMPLWIPSLQSLSVLHLQQSALRGNILESLEDLPSLGELGLFRAYEGTELWFKSGAFKRLKILKLQELYHLRRLIVDKGSMPQLEQLQITDSKLLELPSGIEHLTKLQLLHLHNMGDELTTTLENGDQKSEHYWKIAHIARVLIN